jgi:hypothetical protein
VLTGTDSVCGSKPPFVILSEAKNLSRFRNRREILRFAQNDNRRRSRCAKEELHRKKILQELHSYFGQDGFGVELYAFHAHCAVTQAHDDIAGSRGDFQIGGK